MTTTSSQASLEREPTEVPARGNKQLRVEPGKPWPSAYRGSKYSVTSTRKHGDVVEWSHMGQIRALTTLPDGLKESLQRLGKPGGKGSFRVTASGEVLSKIPKVHYDHASEARAGQGHIPVYVGKLYGDFDFLDFTNDPDSPAPGEVSVWTGLQFNHGETWAVCSDDVLRWTWQDYYFESAFDHPQIVQTYKKYRPLGGRIYINEHGHVWGGVDKNDVPADAQDQVGRAFTEWQQSASTAEKRLVERRLRRTESEDAENGLLSIHLGHLSDFDDGMVPKPVVTDSRYFNDTAMDSDD